jgi:hypothetical protein
LFFLIIKLWKRPADSRVKPKKKMEKPNNEENYESATNKSNQEVKGKQQD